MRYSELMWKWLVLATLFLTPIAHGDEPVRFLIESITIEGARYSSPHILVAESRLVEGHTYTEGELHDAIARVNRLPFVLHTDFRLAKGSERGRYVLVIAIEETKPIFFRWDSLHSVLATTQLVQPYDPLHPTFRDATVRITNDYYTLGGRWFVGAKGVATVVTDQSRCHVPSGLCGTRAPGYSIGYTQYDIFDSRASIAGLIQYREESYDLPSFVPGNGRRTLSFGDHLTYQLTAAAPLFGNHAARATFTRQIEIANTSRQHYDQGELAWLYDTTDDPLFPSRGMFAEAALESRRMLRYLPTPAGAPLETTNPWKHDFDGRLTKYWQLTPQHSISAGTELVTVGANAYAEEHFRAGYAATLLPREQAARFGDMRFELSYDRILLHLHSGNSHGTASRGEGRAGLAYRNAWGVAHLTFAYTGWRHGF